MCNTIMFCSVVFLKCKPVITFTICYSCKKLLTLYDWIDIILKKIIKKLLNSSIWFFPGDVHNAARRIGNKRIFSLSTTCRFQYHSKDQRKWSTVGMRLIQIFSAVCSNCFYWFSCLVNEQMKSTRASEFF